MVEHETLNLRIVGSSPTLGASRASNSTQGLSVVATPFVAIDDLGSDRAADNQSEALLDSGRGTPEVRQGELSGARRLGFQGTLEGLTAVEGSMGRPGSASLSEQTRGHRPFVAGHCLADLRRAIMLARQEMFRVSPDQWERAKEGFHVRFAEIEGQILEGPCVHIGELLAAGQHSRAH